MNLDAARNDECFHMQNRSSLDGLGNRSEAKRWVRAMEKVFDYIKWTEAEKIAFGINQLSDKADFW